MHLLVQMSGVPGAGKLDGGYVRGRPGAAVTKAALHLTV
jgi:hypothetical protein